MTAAPTVPNSARAHTASSATVSVKLIAELTEDEVAACSQLTSATGLMRPQLLRVRGYLQPRYTEPAARHQWIDEAAYGWKAQRKRQVQWARRALECESVMLLHTPANKLVAWALVRSAPSAAPTIYLFVARRYRRRGLGSRLLREARQRWPLALYCPWNESSYAFFNAHDEQVPYTPIGTRWVRDHERGRSLAAAR